MSVQAQLLKFWMSVSDWLRVQLKMWGVLLLVAALASLLQPGATCPDSCQCRQEGRGQRVDCHQGGDLPYIMANLPHNTARLVIQGLTSTHTLQQADMQRSETPSSILRLAITNSALQDVEGSVFTAMTSLQDLDLSGNSIRSIAAGAFEGLSSLRLLNLSSNHIVDLGSALAPLVSLQHLDVSYNYIGELQPTTFQMQSSLSYLRLDGNKFRSLKLAPFQPLAFLSELRVRDCGIFLVTEDFFSAIGRISLLDLGNNRLSNFPSSTAFSELRQLKHLYIDDNQLLKLHSSQFADLSLLTLSLARNRISTIPTNALIGLTVEDLDLSENKLLELKGESLQPIAPHLATLNVANNPIRVLHPHTFEGLRLLETLNISACSLTNLPAETFSHLYNLRKLDASWNHLQNISADLIKIFNRLAVVNLQQNSWHCDCHIVPFRDWLKLSRSLHKLYCLPGRHFKDCSDLKCTSPDLLVGKLISNLVDSQVERCSVGADKAGLPVPIQISIVLACLLFSLGMLLVTMYLWRRGRTRKRLKRIVFQKKRKADSHEEDEEENEKIDPFVDCDNDSLKESHRSFVFRNYFDRMVTDPKLLEPTSPSQVAPSESQAMPLQQDSVYSSNPSLYETSHNSHSIVVGIESTV